MRWSPAGRGNRSAASAVRHTDARALRRPRSLGLLAAVAPLPGPHLVLDALDHKARDGLAQRLVDRDHGVLDYMKLLLAFFLGCITCALLTFQVMITLRKNVHDFLLDRHTTLLTKNHGTHLNFSFNLK
mgnify:CR=1 FL=1